MNLNKIIRWIIFLLCGAGVFPLLAQPGSCSLVRTGENATIIIPDDVPLLLNGGPLPIGAHIIVLYQDSAGLQCGGYATWSNEPLALSVFGDDGDDPGFADGESYSFRIELPNGCVVDSVSVKYQTGGIFTNKGTFSIDGISGIASLEATSLSIKEVFTDPSMDGNDNGKATVVLANGKPPYSFQWNTDPPQTDSIAISLPPGTYSLIITDANNCQVDTTALIDLVYATSQLTIVGQFQLIELGRKEIRFSYQLPESLMLESRLIDTSGRVLAKRKFGNSNTGYWDLPLSNQPMGWYVIHLFSGRQAKTISFILK